MTQENLSPSELYAINLNENDPKYFSLTPGIIFHCTYVAKEKKKGKKHYGELVRKKISPHAIALYTCIRQIAGQNSACWSSTSYLSALTGMSAGMISEAKADLTQPIEQLNGKPLLEITEKRKKVTQPDGSVKSVPYHQIVPTHIWPENNAYMATISYQENLELGLVSRSQCESQPPSRSQCETDSLGSRSQCETNKTEKNSSVNETEPARCASGCSSSEKGLFEENQEKIAKAKQAMRSSGSDENFIREMTKRFTPQRILDAGFYVQQMAKRKRISNLQGYFRKAIESGRKWEYQEN